ncbi:hypothetical protein NMY22_g2971 [Coprinellus aureogranulatus]|nr:hypothetical protein NMY22_g2971 [Coprinellus aureogranulatus]
MPPHLPPRFRTQAARCHVDSVTSSLQSLAISAPVPPRIRRSETNGLKIAAPGQANRRRQQANSSPLPERIIRIAPRHSIAETASALQNFLLDPDSCSYDVKQRLRQVLKLLNGHDQGVSASFSRSAVLIALALLKKLQFKCQSLAGALTDAMASSAKNCLTIALLRIHEYTNGGLVSIDVWEEWRAEIQFGVAFFADSYAFGFINTDAYWEFLNVVITVVQSPDLFYLVVIPFLSRGLTHSGRKLSKAHFDCVAANWAEIRSRIQIDVRSDKQKLKQLAHVSTALGLLRHDALTEGDLCELPFREFVDEEDQSLTQLCEAIIRKASNPEQLMQEEEVLSKLESMELPIERDYASTGVTSSMPMHRILGCDATSSLLPRYTPQSAFSDSRADMNRISDPVDSLLDSFTHFNPFQRPYREDEAREYLFSMRTFVTANNWAVMGTGDMIRRYVFGLGPDNEDAEKQRVHKVLDILLNDERMNIDNSRALAHILKESVQELWLTKEKLGTYFSETAVKQILKVFYKLWTDAVVLSSEIERGNALIDLSNLRFITAFIGDLYSADAFPEPEFLNAVDFLVRVIPGPTLFDIFIYYLLARALTSLGDALAPEKWRDIAMRWNTISCGNTHGLTGVAISLFHKDAMSMIGRCGIEWDSDFSDEMSALCDLVTAAFRCRMWDEEEGRVIQDREQDYLADDLSNHSHTQFEDLTHPVMDLKTNSVSQNGHTLRKLPQNSPFLASFALNMDALSDYLASLTLSNDQVSYEDARQYLIVMRTFIILPTATTSLVAREIVRSIIRKRDEAGQMQKLFRNVEAVITDEDMEMGMSPMRSTTHIIIAARELLRSHSDWMPIVFMQRVIERVSELFIELWNGATQLSAECGTIAERKHLKELGYMSGQLADLYSQRILNEEDFVRLMHHALEKAQTSILFHLFIFYFLARALTADGRRISVEEWLEISRRWDIISGEAKHSSPITIALQLFIDDASKGPGHCDIEWDDTTTKMDVLLHSLAGLTLSPNQGGDDKARAYLTRVRTFPLAPHSTISIGAKQVSRDIIDGATDEERQRRARENAECLIVGETLESEYARSKAHLIVATMFDLQPTCTSLALYFAQAAVELASDMFAMLWNDAPCGLPHEQSDTNWLSQQFRITSNLSYSSRLLADLYSCGLIDFDAFLGLVHLALDKARTLHLFHVFLFHFLARAFTADGQNLPLEEWRKISRQWDLVSGGNPHFGLTTAVINLFIEDAKAGSGRCELEWGTQPWTRG